MKTIAVDFDGVIHKYSKGWHDGTIYDEPIEGCFEAIKELMDNGYSVFVFSTRKSKQIKKWLENKVYESEYISCGLGGDPEDFSYPKYGFSTEIIKFWTKFWNKPYVLGITNKKLPAVAYIDDRAIKFEGNWNRIVNEIKENITIK